MADLESLLDLEVEYAREIMDEQYTLKQQSPSPQIEMYQRTPPPIVRNLTPPPLLFENNEMDDITEHLERFNIPPPDKNTSPPPRKNTSPPPLGKHTPQKSSDDMAVATTLHVSPVIDPEIELARRENNEREKRADLISEIQEWAEYCNDSRKLEPEDVLFALPISVLEDKHAKWSRRNENRKYLKMARDIWCAFTMMTGYSVKKIIDVLKWDSPIEIMRMVRQYCATVLMHNAADEPLKALVKLVMPKKSASGHGMYLAWTGISFIYEEWNRQQQQKDLMQKKVDAERQKLEWATQQELIQKAKEHYQTQQNTQGATPTLHLFSNNTKEPIETTTTTVGFMVPDVLENAEEALQTLDLDEDDEDEKLDVPPVVVRPPKDEPRRSRRHK